MSAAPALIQDPYPGGLTGPQWGMLQAVAATRMDGHEASFGNPTLNALERRGYVELRGRPSLSRVQRWYATAKGHDLIAADKRERGIGQGPLHRISPSKRSPWEGVQADYSRFTAGQVLELDKRGIDHRRVPLVMVQVPVPEDELYVPAGQARPVRRFACPRVGMCRKPGFEGRVAVLTPSGDFAGVMPDGSDPRLYATPARPRAAAPYGRESWG